MAAVGAKAEKARSDLPVMSAPVEAEVVRGALERLDVGVVCLDRDWCFRYVNSAATQLVRRDAAELLGQNHWELFPELRGGPVEGAYLHAVESGEPTTVEHYYAPYDSWYETVAVPHAQGLDLFFANVDSRHRAESERATATASMESAARRLVMLAEAGRVLALALDVDTTLHDALRLIVPAVGVCGIIHLLEDGELRVASAHHADPLVSQARTLWGFPNIRHPDTQKFGAGWVVRTGQSQSLPPLTEEVGEGLLPGHGKELASLGLTGGVAVPLTARGRVLGCLSVGRDDGTDIDPGEQALLEEIGSRIAVAVDNARLYAEAQAAASRLELLADVSRTIGATMEPTEVLRNLAQLVVPLLADWCIVSLVETVPATGGLKLVDVGVSHRDPTLLPRAEAYADRRTAALHADAPVFRTLRTGEPLQVQLTPETIAATLRDPEVIALFAELDAASAVAVPILAHGRSLGVITFFSGSERAPMTDAEIEVAREVAVRAGLALENARLFAQQRHTAEVLQRSLLTAPPEPNHLHVVVRYSPAVSEAQVGGDWYDSFLTADGATTLVIGDVMGHDTIAAAAMGQLRTLVRGIAFDRREGPARVLERVDQAIAALAPGVLATTLMARIEQNDDERATGMQRIRWSSAGHPPALLLHPDGTVEQLARQENLLLGLDASTERTEHEVALEPGATLLLYTDGLVERRGESFTVSLVRLEETLFALREETLDDLCDGLLEQLLPDGAADDVAIVAVRARRAA